MKWAGAFATSFGRIFYRNAINLGIPLFVAPEVVAGLENGAEVTPDLVQEQITAGEQQFSLPLLARFVWGGGKKGAARVETAVHQTLTYSHHLTGTKAITGC